MLVNSTGKLAYGGFTAATQEQVNRAWAGDLWGGLDPNF